MGKAVLAFGFAVVTSVAGAAHAQQPDSGGGAIEIGARLGFGYPLGSEGRTATDTNDTKLSDDISGIIPIWIDAGYRINPNLYVGLFFQYAFGLVNTDNNPECNQSGFSCSVSDMRFGANLHYHLAPGQSFDPWLGIGAGYEWLGLSVSQGATSVTGTAGGFEFANFQLGGDISASPSFKVGPFVSFSLGRYRSFSLSSGGQSMDMDITNESLHEWLVVGVRAAYDIGI